MLGRPRVVDEDSVASRDGPIRMLFHSQAPDRLPKSILLFANLRGYRIGVSVEATKDSGPKPSIPNDKRKYDGEDKDNGQEQTKDQSQSDYHWKRQNNKAKGKMKDTGASGMPVGTPRALDPMESTPP
jgi:hypothetical protein